MFSFKITYLLFIIIVLFVSSFDCLPNLIRIGGLFSADEEEEELVFRYAVDRINADKLILPRSTLIAQVERVFKDDNFHAHNKACGLLRNGVAAIFGPLNDMTSMQVHSICDALEIPHMDMRWDFQLQRADLSINLYPRPSVLSKAYIDLVNAWNWKSFAIAYEENDGIIRFRDFFKEKYKWNIKLFQFPREHHQYRNVFKEIKNQNIYNIILDVKRENIHEAMKQAQQVGAVNEKYSYLITSLDSHTINMEDFMYGDTKITAYRLVDPSYYDLRSLLSQWSSHAARMGKRLSTKPPENISTQSALLFDAVKLTAKALQELDDGKRYDFYPINCDNGIPAEHGTSLINYMRQIAFRGYTGDVSFDQSGFRSGVSLDLITLTPNGYSKIGSWNEKTHNGVNVSESWIKHFSSLLLKNKTLVITTVVNPPYTMIKSSHNTLEGNDRFEGFAIDLITELSQMLKFNYVIKLVRDGKHGGKKDDGTWNGMVGEVMNGDADIAVADVTINSVRETAIDFTHPFLYMGISILYRKATTKETKLFSFLEPFSKTVWVYVLGTFIGVSIILYFSGRFSPYEWGNPHPCRQDDRVYENIFSLSNSSWFTIGSIMQQGCDIAPKALSSRCISGIWYFFTLIMISSYTANLAAFLTIEKTTYPFENVQQLAAQNKVKYGCMAGGSTLTFFKNSNETVYKQMYQYMINNPGVLLPSNQDGPVRVEKDNGGYAFFMESASIEYIVERYCNLTQIGGLLDNKGYGIATRKNDPIRNPLSEAILKLQETGVISVLKDRWWKQKGDGGKCSAVATTSSVPELGISNVGGVFLVLIFGMFVAFLMAIFEFVWRARKSSDPGYFFDYMTRDLKYIMDCQSSTKPVIKNSDLMENQKSEKSMTPSIVKDFGFNGNIK